MDFLHCLPTWLTKILSHCDNLREIRLRDNAPVKVNVGGNWLWCTAMGVEKSISNAKLLDVPCCKIVEDACNNSVYAYEGMLAKGFFTLHDGSRFGVAGEYSQKGAFKTFTSICIRAPHVVNCATAQMLQSVKEGNCLILGRPASGKTTLLRDVAYRLSVEHNVVVIDERGELDVCDCLQFCDVLKWTSKHIGIEIAVRSLAPQFVVCDEISPDDILAIKYAISCGVTVIATMHASLETFKSDKLSEIRQLFDTCVLCERVGVYQIIS